jgi:steroid delta-isomerase-like uncharacterized protein
MRKGLLLLVALVICTPALAQPVSEQERNKQVARSFFEEALNRGHLDRYAESHSKDFVAHAGNHEATLQEDLAAAQEERKTFPDLKMSVDHIVAEGDMVVVHWTASGTNTQAGMGIPATGKTMKTSGMTLFRFKDGKICEEWSAWDMLSVMRQLGLLPPQQ